MFKPLSLMLDRIVRTGNLTFIDSQGSSNRSGDGSGSPVLIRLRDRKLERELVLDPELASGEAYMQGRLVVEEGSLYDFIALMMANLADSPFPAWSQSLAAAPPPPGGPPHLHTPPPARPHPP